MAIGKGRVGKIKQKLDMENKHIEEFEKILTEFGSSATSIIGATFAFTSSHGVDTEIIMGSITDVAYSSNGATKFYTSSKIFNGIKLSYIEYTKEGEIIATDSNGNQNQIAHAYKGVLKIY